MIKKQKTSSQINAYQYASDFENISLEIVKINYVEVNDIISKDITQETRDQGVDAYIIFKANNTISTYTIEAKLRNSMTLSLKDFASSIIYCLINTSSWHFIVTNVTFSKEAQNSIHQLNHKKHKMIELVDGFMLKNTINENLALFNKYPEELINFLRNKELYLNNRLQSKKIEIVQHQIYVNLDSLKEKSADLKIMMNNGYKLFLVIGLSGIGKRTFINKYVEQNFDSYNFYRIDVSKTQTSKLLVYDFLDSIIGFNVQKIFTNLYEQEKLTYHDIINNDEIFISYNEDLIEAFGILINNDNLSNEELIYYMNKIMIHIIENFIHDFKTVIIIENLHTATADLIKFVLDLVQCFIEKKIYVIINIIKPQNSTQLYYVKTEQWYGYLNLLEDLSINGKKCKKIELNNYTNTEIYKVIQQIIPSVSLTTDYLQYFIDYFGTKPIDVFDALDIIKRKKLYSITQLQNMLSLTVPAIIESIIRELVCLENPQKDFYEEVISYTILFEGKIYLDILEHLSSKYHLSSTIEIINTGLYKEEDNYLVLKQGLSLKTLKSYKNLECIKSCIEWLIHSIDNIKLNIIDKKYFTFKFEYILKQENTIDKGEILITYFCKQQAYIYAIEIANMLYDYYNRTSKVLSFIYLVKYLELLGNVNLYNTEKLSILIDTAERLRREILYSQKESQEFMKADINLAFINYKKAKACYNYEKCEIYIEYILNYENRYIDDEVFIIARIYKALIMKERGLRNEYIISFVDTIRKYPYNTELKTSYYANMAAIYKNTSMERSIKLLRLIEKISFNETNGIGDLWTKIDLMQYQCYCNEFDFNELIRVRSIAEKMSSTNNLARTFNLEGYNYIKQEKISASLECFEAAASISLAAGGNKEYYLFSLNLMTAMSILGLDYEEKLLRIIDWFTAHSNKIYERLSINSYRNNDHMYAALISMIILIKKHKKSSLLSDIGIEKHLQLIFNMDFDELKNSTTSYKHLIDSTANFYLLNNSVFILF